MHLYLTLTTSLGVISSECRRKDWYENTRMVWLYTVSSINSLMICLATLDTAKVQTNRLTYS